MQGVTAEWKRKLVLSIFALRNDDRTGRAIQVTSLPYAGMLVFQRKTVSTQHTRNNAIDLISAGRTCTGASLIREGQALPGMKLWPRLEPEMPLIGQFSSQ